MGTYLRSSYDILNKIYREKAFSTEALFKTLDKTENAELVHRLVLGVLDKNVELEYIISQLTEKMPKPAAVIVLKQGLYCLKYMNSLPDYAVIDGSVELIKHIGKRQLAGFVNAVLKKAARGEYQMPADDNSAFSLSIKYSKPQWLVEKLTADYGLDTAVKIIAEPPFALTHIRPNKLVWDKNRLEKYLNSIGAEFYPTAVGGFAVKLSPKIKQLFRDGKITYQSATSMYAVKALDVKNGMRVLDICAAPGGKSVLIAESNPDGEIIACDLYPHRVELINAYARRMNVKNIFPRDCDATIFNPEFEGRFDRVLVDAPCSALGIVRKQPDILLNRKPEDIDTLAELQLEILTNASKYLKKDGILIYATCTLTKEENGDNAARLLAADKTLKLISVDLPDGENGTVQFLPDKETDGFYVAKFVKL